MDMNMDIVEYVKSLKNQNVNLYIGTITKLKKYLEEIKKDDLRNKCIEYLNKNIAKVYKSKVDDIFVANNIDCNTNKMFKNISKKTNDVESFVLSEREGCNENENKTEIIAGDLHRTSEPYILINGDEFVQASLRRNSLNENGYDTNSKGFYIYQIDIKNKNIELYACNTIGRLYL